MSAHTPGPWEPRDTADYAEIVAADGTVVAMVGHQRDVGPVAASPEMLAALQAALPIMSENMRDGYDRGDGKDFAAVKLMRAAIEKATGEPA